MRIQICHQTVYQMGQPRETAITLSDEELNMLRVLVTEYTNFNDIPDMDRFQYQLVELLK